jgi:hypothetical protein
MTELIHWREIVYSCEVPMFNDRFNVSRSDQPITDQRIAVNNSGWIYRSRQLAAPLQAEFGTNLNRDRLSNRSSARITSSSNSSSSGSNSSNNNNGQTSTSVSLTERVGGSRPSDRSFDRYTFTVNRVGSGKLKVRALDSGSLQLSLGRDRNSNGQIDAGEIIANKRAKSGKQTTLTLKNLTPGNYIFQVSTTSTESKDYTLAITGNNLNVQGLD